MTGAVVESARGGGPLWLLGDNLRTRRERAARPEAKREANVRRAAAEEQARIGRELHDVIGHSVSVMTIQAAAARDAFDQRPAQVGEALRAIESTGRETLAELRRLLAGVGTEFAASPGLANLDALVERVRAAGLALELSAERRPEPLPPSVDLSAYRIVQEALANTLKHAHASHARVDVRQGNGALEIEVADDGQGVRGAARPRHHRHASARRAVRQRSQRRPCARRRLRGPHGSRLPSREPPRAVRDDQALVRSRFRLILETREDYEVVGATRRLTALGVPARVLMLTTFDLDSYVYEAIRAGASGKAASASLRVTTGQPPPVATEQQLARDR